MSLRHKLILLLASFATFAVVAATATIYGIQWRVEGAVASLTRSVGQSQQVDELNVLLRQQLLHLRELTLPGPDAVRPYFESTELFSSRLRQVARFAVELGQEDRAAELVRLADEFEREADLCLAAIRAEQYPEARRILDDRLTSELAPQLQGRLVQAKSALEESRHRATRELSATATRTLALAIVVAGCAAVLVVIGAVLIRRWLIVPIAGLRAATRRFSEGDFSYRVANNSSDELGMLGNALNEMAQRVSNARASLAASENKHRALFRNLRDAAVICDIEGRIIEAHDGETQLLGVEGDEHVGRKLLDVWPEWAGVASDWASTIEAAVVRGKRFRVAGARVARADGREEDERFCDFLVYRADYGGARYAVIIARDVSERQRLQSRLRRAETLEAIGTLAGGLAHDFNNLLAGVTGTLSLLASEITDTHHAERIRIALRACWQAAGLSRRLLNFATSAHGTPQVFMANEMVDTILNSLDSSFLEGVALQRELEVSSAVRMDRDQFTQVVMNLIRNARDAMPDGGRLRIAIETESTHDPDETGPDQLHTVLTIEDTGHGMTPEVQKRVFEPLFTTKSRAARRGRGLGMAVVYTAVKNAGGFIRIKSEPNVGTSVRVFLPISAEPVTPQDPSPVTQVIPKGHGKILLIDDDSLTREAWSNALEGWGYSVVTAESLEDAAPLLRARALGVVDLALVDLTSLDGETGAAAERFVACDPNLRILLTSGSETGPIPAAFERRICARLLKPFRLEELASAVAGAILPHER